MRNRPVQHQHNPLHGTSQQTMMGKLRKLQMELRCLLAVILATFFLLIMVGFSSTDLLIMYRKDNKYEYRGGIWYREICNRTKCGKHQNAFGNESLKNRLVYAPLQVEHVSMHVFGFIGFILFIFSFKKKSSYIYMIGAMFYGFSAMLSFSLFFHMFMNLGMKSLDRLEISWISYLLCAIGILCAGGLLLPAYCTIKGICNKYQLLNVYKEKHFIYNTTENEYEYLRDVWNHIHVPSQQSITDQGQCEEIQQCNNNLNRQSDVYLQVIDNRN